MCSCRRLLLLILGTLVLASPGLRADPNDVAGARDYPGFPRPQGYVITDYDEDNPADFDFSVSRPVPIDLDHIEKVHVTGHRYVIQYAKDAAVPPPTLLQIQQYYEKIAAAAEFTVEKNGVVGDVSETFHRTANGRDVWVSLDPAISSNVLTVVEACSVIAATAPSPTQATAPISTPRPSRGAVVPTSPASETNDSPVAADPNGEAIYASLNADGRVVVPLSFLPGREDVDDASLPVIDRVAAMMRHHPDLFLRIEGHTDNTGDEDDNLRLSAQRAFAVQALLAKAGIDKIRLDPVGVGGLQPIADNNTAQGRASNRRIELVLRKKPAGFHTTAPNGQNYYPSAG